MWKQLDGLSVNRSQDRQIMETALLGSLDDCRINADDMNVKVPDLLLRECEQDIQRVGNLLIYVSVYDSRLVNELNIDNVLVYQSFTDFIHQYVYQFLNRILVESYSNLTHIL